MISAIVTIGDETEPAFGWPRDRMLPCEHGRPHEGSSGQTAKHHDGRVGSRRHSPTPIRPQDLPGRAACHALAIGP